MIVLCTPFSYVIHTIPEKPNECSGRKVLSAWFFFSLSRQKLINARKVESVTNFDDAKMVILLHPHTIVHLQAMLETNLFQINLKIFKLNL